MFMNGPTRGADVFMPLDFIIGGPAMAGQGWRMLMECLAAGRSISLPASNTGMSQLTARAVGAYARSEEHTSELQSLMRISYAVFCLKKKNIRNNQPEDHS